MVSYQTWMPMVLPPETMGSVERTRTDGWERSHCSSPWLRAKGSSSAGGGSDWLATKRTQPGPRVTALMSPLLEPLPPKSRLWRIGFSPRLVPQEGGDQHAPGARSPGQAKKL